MKHCIFYKTKDFYLALFLKSKGINMIKKFSHNKDKYYYFENNPRIPELKESYHLLKIMLPEKEKNSNFDL